MKIFVVDASVAAKWFLEEEHTADALRLLEVADFLHAPEHFSLEIDHVLCKKVRRGELAYELAEEIRKALDQFPIQKLPSAGLRDLAFTIAVFTGRALYDCLYLALALLRGVPMVTADRKLHDALAQGPLAPYLCWVEDLEPRRTEQPSSNTDTSPEP